jgi:hypothetical protein
MTKSQIFKSQFPNFKGALNFFTFDDEQLNFIDVVSDTVEFTITKQGYIPETEVRVQPLSFIMDGMTNDEFSALYVAMLEVEMKSKTNVTPTWVKGAPFGVPRHFGKNRMEILSTIGELNQYLNGYTTKSSLQTTLNELINKL